MGRAAEITDGRGGQVGAEAKGGRPCCVANGLDLQFTEAYAREELAAYRKHGLGEQARLLVGFLKGQGLAGRTVLEIGCGIGALHLELLKAGAARAVGVDASPACIEAARALAGEMGLAERTQHLLGDFVGIESEVSGAEIVLLDRVICCYPDMETLVGAAARHAWAFCGLAYPRRGWWMRPLFWGINLWQVLWRTPYRAYYHDPRRVAQVLRAESFAEVYWATAGFWEVAVFRRAA